MQPWETAFRSRVDLEPYTENAIGLFALALRFGIEDLETTAANSITDGNDDKKCDIVHIDEEDEYAVLMQCYVSSKIRTSAPANKASDLNTAITWLLQSPTKKLPKSILSQAISLRDGITNKTIKNLNIWYVHNLPESSNVENELSAVEASAKAIIEANFPGNKLAIHVLEVGQERFKEWYEDTQSPILVNDKVKVKYNEGYKISGPEWSAFVTAIPAKFLHSVYKKYGSKLFSANVREYLGSRSSDSNINNGIKKSVEEAPENFWVYNNGITVLVNSFDSVSEGNESYLHIEGMSIVNGAQTTGAIGSLKKISDKDAYVPARFVKTANLGILFNIIHYNNSQNKITASDFRSNDRIQKRLKEQFEKIPDTEYEGGRRGGSVDIIKRRPNLLPSYTVGQALAAVHADPIIAYNEKTNIWVSDTLYSRYFNEDTNAPHIVFAYSLLRVVENFKSNLLQKSKGGDGLTAAEEEQLNYFRKRGSIYLFVSALSASLETFINKKIPNLAKVSFGSERSPQDAEEIWKNIVKMNAPLSVHLEEAISDGLKNAENTKKVIKTFQSLVSATYASNSAIYQAFTHEVSIK